MQKARGTLVKPVVMLINHGGVISIGQRQRYIRFL